jgi:hypothetical protein
MSRRYLLAAIVIVSCSVVVVVRAASPSKYEELARQPTPATWASGSPWHFTITGKDHQGEALTLFFGDEPVQTCVAGSWKLATMMGTSISNPPLEDWYRAASEGGAGLYAAYQIVGRNLHVVLNAPVCDNNWVLRGVLSETGAAGRFVAESPYGSEILGTFATALTPKLLFAHELQMPIEQAALQRQFDALRFMQLPKLEYAANGPVGLLHGDTGIVLPRSVRSLKEGDSATEVSALLKDLLLAKGTEVPKVRLHRADDLDELYVLSLDYSIRGIPVYEGTVDIRYDPRTRRATWLIAGHFVPDRGLPREPRLSATEAETIVVATLQRSAEDAVEMLPGTHLVYYVGWANYPAQRPDGSRPPPMPPLAPRLAWVVNALAPWKEVRVVDALSGEIFISRSSKPTIN